MQIVSIKPDGTVVVEMDPREVRDVHDDLVYIPFTKITPAGAKLWALLEAIVGRESL